jgi:hypothetical protein
VAKAAIPAGLIGGAVLAFAKTTVDAASRTEQAMGAVESVFGRNADQVKAWSKTSADAVGLSQAAYLEMAAVTGAQLKGMGVPLEQVTGQTNDLIKMGADLAAQFGGTTADAVAALGSTLRGEFDPIEKYGISIKQSDINAKKAADGTAKLTGAAGKNASAMATLALLTAGAADAHGAFARETDTAAHAQQVATAKWQDAQAAIGQALLPAVVALSGALSGLASFMHDNAAAANVLMGVILGLVGAVLAVNVAMKIYAAGQAVAAAATALSTSTLGTWLGIKYLELVAWLRTAPAAIAAAAAVVASTTATIAASAASKAAAAAQWLWNVAMSANPIGLVIIAVIALVAVIILLWNRSAAFRAFVLGMWAAIQTAAAAVGRVIVAVWGVVWAVLRAYVTAYLTVVRAVFNAVVAVITAAFNGIRSVVSSVTGWVTRTWASMVAGIRGAMAGLASVLAAPFHAVQSAVGAVVSAVQTLVGWLGRIKVPSISWPKPPSWLSSVIGKSAPPAPGAGVGGGGFRSAGLYSTRTGGTAQTAPTIVIQGAVDPESTARQIRRILDAHDRRVGLTGALRTGTV